MTGQELWAAMTLGQEYTGKNMALTSSSSVLKKRSSAASCCVCARTTLSEVVRGEKATPSPASAASLT